MAQYVTCHVSVSITRCRATCPVSAPCSREHRSYLVKYSVHLMGSLRWMPPLALLCRGNIVFFTIKWVHTHTPCELSVFFSLMLEGTAVSWETLLLLHCAYVNSVNSKWRILRLLSHERLWFVLGNNRFKLSCSTQPHYSSVFPYGTPQKCSTRNAR
jgi:hypothetical protein